MFPKVVKVMPMRDYTVYVYFEDGKIVHYDMTPMIGKGVFSPLKDINVFMDTCTVLNDTLAWDLSKNQDNTACLDIDPFTLYSLPLAEERMGE